MGQSSSGSGGALVVLASGTITGLTQAVPKTIDFRTYAAVGEYDSFELIYKNLASSAAMATSADPFFQLMVDAAAQATTYGFTVGNETAGVGFADTNVVMAENSGFAQVISGGGKITFENLFVNAQPFGTLQSYTRHAAAGTLTGKQCTWHRATAAIHNGILFGVNAADVDTYSFDWILRAIRKL